MVDHKQILISDFQYINASSLYEVATLMFGNKVKYSLYFICQPLAYSNINFVVGRVQLNLNLLLRDYRLCEALPEHVHLRSFIRVLELELVGLDDALPGEKRDINEI